MMAKSANDGRSRSVSSTSTLSSSISLREKWLFASASLGIFGPAAAFIVWRNALFIYYLGASASSLGMVGIILGAVNALNGPIVSYFADSGFLNRKFSKIFPVEKWGRRAPWILCGTPLMILGAAGGWFYPDARPSSSAPVVAWYFGCYFLIVNGGTAAIQSYLASIQELFPTSAERSTQVFRNTPFVLLSFIFAAAIAPFLAFNGQQPDDLESCCADTPCNAPPPCACYDNASAIVNGASYVDSYAQKCSALDQFPQGNITENAAYACGELYELGSFRITGLVFFLVGLTAFLAIIPARKTPIRTIDKNHPSLVNAVKQTLKSVPFRYYAGIMHINAVFQALIVSNLSLYMLYVMRVDSDRLATGFAVTAVLTLGIRLPVLPIYLYLLKTKGIHPGKLLSVTCLVEAVVLPPLFFGSRCSEEKCMHYLWAAGAVMGLLESGHDMCLHNLIGWSIDEDAQKNRGVRREGNFYAVNGLIQHLSEIWTSLILSSYDWLGLDGKKCPSDQPTAAMDAIFYSFAVTGFIAKFLVAFLAYRFPIKGARLEQVKRGIAELEELQETSAIVET